MDTQGWYEVIEFAPDTYQIWAEAGRWNMFLLVGGEKALSLDGGIGVGSVSGALRVDNRSSGGARPHPHALGPRGRRARVGVGGRPPEREGGARERLHARAAGISCRRGAGNPSPRGSTPRPSPYPPESSAGRCQEGDVIDLGGRKIHVYDTPGHSPCSISLYDERERVLITGDLVKPGQPLFIQVPTAVLSQYGPSMRRLQRIAEDNDARFVCSGHTDPCEDISIIGRMAQFVEEVAAGRHEPPAKVEAGKWGVVDEYVSGDMKIWTNDNARK